MEHLLDVITIGDGMITMDPSSIGPLRFSNHFERKIGGAELNFAIGCSRLGLNTGWISKLGNDEFGRHILFCARGEGLDTRHVELVEGYPTSVYFREVLADGSGRSFYYREKSPTLSFSEADFCEDYFKNSRLLHITGVFPSINPNNRKIIKKAIEIAKKNGILVSLDPNIRLKMWTKSEAREFLLDILPDVNILLAGEDEAEIILGKHSTHEYIEKFQQYGISLVVIKRGDKGAIGADGSQVLSIEPVKPRAVVDTVGAGDGFDAGFITGYLKGFSLKRSLELANAVGSMVISVKGDNEGLPYYEDVLAYLGETEYVER